MDRMTQRSFDTLTISIRHPLPLVAEALSRALQHLTPARVTAETGDILLSPLALVTQADCEEGRRIIILADRTDRRMLMEAKSMGAIGLVPLDLPLECLNKALASAIMGEGYWPILPDATTLSPVSKRLGSLSGQQFKVLDLMSRGRLNKQIAYDLGISEGTVKSHVSSVLRKLGVERRTQAIAAFITTQDVMGGLIAPAGAAHAAR